MKVTDLNSLKSIYSRITSIQPAIDAMADIGIHIKDSAGEMRDVSDILDDLGGKWSTLSAEQQQNLGLQIAGRFQLSRFLILMEQYDEALGATDAALNSAGSGYRENAEYLKSYEAQINMVKNAWTEAVIAMRDGGLGDTMILGLKTGLELLKVLTSIIDTFGTFPTVIGLGAIAISTFSSKTRGALVGIGSQLMELATGFSRVSATSTATQTSIAKTTQSMNVMSTSALRAKSSVDMLSASQAASSKSAGVLNGSVLTASGSVQRFGTASSAGATGAKALGMSLAATGVAAKGFASSLMMASLPIAIFSGLAWAIGKVVGKISEQVQEQKELERSIKETMDTNVSAVTANMQQVDALRGSYKSLSEEKERAGDTGSWDTEKEQEYLQVQQELADIFPALIKEIDSKGQAHLINADAIEEEIARTKELANIEGGRALHNEIDTYKESMENLSMYQDKVRLAEHQMTRYQEKADKARTESAREAHLSKVNNYQAEMIHYEAIVREIESSTKQEMKNLSNIFMQVNDISGKVAEESQRIFDSIDISSKTKEEIADIRRELDLFAKDRQKAFDTGDMEAFNAKTTELKNYLTDALEMPKEDVSEFITYFNSLKLEIEEAEEKAKRTARAMEDLGLEMDDGTESADEFAEMLGAVSEEMGKVTDEISSINSILETYHENGELSNQQLLDLIEKYPDLIQFINDEERLIEELTETRDRLAKKSEQHLINQLMLNNDFYNNNLDLIQDFVDEQFKFYEKDLKQWQNLAQAKADVETELINKLSKQWGVYYNEVTRQFDISPEKQVQNILSGTMIDPVNSKLMEKELMNIAAANAKLKASADAWNNFALDKVSIDFKTLGTSADKAAGSIGGSSKSKRDSAKASEEARKEAEKYNKEIEHSIYLADTYSRAMELLNLEMSKVTIAKNNAAKGSNEYRKALKEELKLLELELGLIKERSKSVQHQISTGNVAKTGIVSSTASGGSAQATVWNYFKARGLDDRAVAGIMGNIQQESGFNPKSVNRSSGASGIFQWLGSRKTELQNYAKQVGKSWEDLNVQLEFAWRELNSSEKRALTSLQKSMSASQHASEFDRLFERSGRSQVAKRQSYANDFYSQFTGGAQSGNSVADYYLGNTFRLSSGFGKRNTGIPGASTYHQGIDLAAPAGTDIKSLRSGKVIASYYQNAQGHVVRVQQDDGIVAQYQHMQSKSPIAVGQSVSAGQSIGKVGKTGVASGNHLHLEITANGKKVDPKKYLDEQGKAIASSSKDFAQNAQDIDGLHSELIKLSQEELATIEKIMRLNEEYVESHLARYDKLISGVDKSIAKVDKTLIEHSRTSEGYRKSLAERNKHMEYQQNLLHKEANYIREQLKNDALSAEMKERLREKLSELSLEWLDVRDAIKETNMEIINSRSNQFNDLISGVDQSLSKIDKQLQYYDEGGFAYLAVLEEQIGHLEYKQTLLKKHEESLREQLRSGELTADQAREIEIEVSNIVLAWWDVENAITGTNDRMKESKNDLADDLIDSMKAVYEFQKQQALSAIDAEIEAEEKRHRKKMKHYDDELSAYEKIIQAKLREIDDEYDEDQYEKQLRKMQEEQSEIQQKINLLALDDSYEAKAERVKLEEELAEQTEKIQEFQDDRERKLRKDNLNDMLDDYREDTEAKKKSEEEKHKAEIDRLKELRKAEEYRYNEILKNERKWSAIREDIRNGEIGKHKEFLDEFLGEFENMNEETLKGLQETFYELGLSWQELLNLMDRVQDSSENIERPQKPSDEGGAEGSKNAIERMKDNSSKWQESSASERLQLEKENQVLGESIGAKYDSTTGVWHKNGRHLYHSDEVQETVDLMEQNASKWSEASPDMKKVLSEQNQELGKSIGAKHDPATGIWYKDGLRLYHKGGIVGDRSMNKETELANRMFNAKPNEQVIKALKGELMIPQSNVPNLFGNISQLLKDISAPAIFSGGDSFHIEFNIDKMTGDENDVRRFGDDILRTLSREVNDKFKRERGGM